MPSKLEIIGNTIQFFKTPIAGRIFKTVIKETVRDRVTLPGAMFAPRKLQALVTIPETAG